MEQITRRMEESFINKISLLTYWPMEDAIVILN